MRTLAFVGALSLITGTAMASPISWVASGTIVGTAGDSASLPLSPQPGDAFSYSITFDNETPDTDISTGAGNFPGAILSATFSIGGQSYDLPVGAGSLAYTYNDSGADYYQLTFQTQSAPFGTYPNLVSQFGFSSTSPLAFDTDALPTFPPSDLSIYQVSFDLYELQNSDQASGTVPFPTIFGQVNSIVMQPTSVPEPTTAALLAIGLLGMGWVRRRRHV